MTIQDAMAEAEGYSKSMERQLQNLVVARQAKELAESGDAKAIFQVVYGLYQLATLRHDVIRCAMKQEVQSDISGLGTGSN